MLSKLKVIFSTALRKRQPTIPLPPTMPPTTKVDPNSIVLHYRGQPNHLMVREAFAFGQWCGNHNTAATIRTPGDGTMRLVFSTKDEEVMFRLSWSDKIQERKF